MIKLPPRQERFCQTFVVYANASLAARNAGYASESAYNQGYRLLAKRQIKERIAEIQKMMADDQCRHHDQLLGKLENIYRRAIEDHNYSAAARAVEMQAWLAGKAEKTDTIQFNEMMTNDDK